MKCKTDALTLHNKRAGNTVGTGKRMRRTGNVCWRVCSCNPETETWKGT